jgi:hypothetical protein
MPLIKIPTTANSNILNLLMRPPSSYSSIASLEQTATILFRLNPVSTAPRSTALLRDRHDLAMNCPVLL